MSAEDRAAMSPGVALNVRAHRTALEVACSFCDQPAGAPCVTARGREAAFAHMRRVNTRRAELAQDRPSP